MFILLSGVVLAGLQLLIGDFDGAWATIQNSLNSFLELILSLVGVSLEEFKETWGGNLDLLVVILNEVGDRITEGLNDIFDSISTFLSNAGQAIRDKRDAFRQAGIDLIRGLGDGIKSQVAFLLDSLKAALQKVIDLTNRIFGNSSPSTVFAGIGSDIVAGMEQGLLGGLPRVEQILDGLSPEGLGPTSLAPAMNTGGRNTSVVFNITGGNPEDIARQISRTLKLQGIQI